MAANPSTLNLQPSTCRAPRLRFQKTAHGNLRGRLFLAWMPQARDVAREPGGLVAAQDRGQPSPRPAGDADIAEGGVEGGADLGTPTSKSKGQRPKAEVWERNAEGQETSNIEHRTSNFECGQAGAEDSRGVGFNSGWLTHEGALVVAGHQRCP